MKVTWCILLFLLKSTTAVLQRIINGTIAFPAEFPFAVAILHQKSYHCCGSIITTHHVLTAGHCFFDDDPFHPGKSIPLSKEDMVLSVGSSQWMNGKRHQVDNIIIHPNFIYKFLYNDIAIVKSALNFVFNDHVQWIPLYPYFVGDDKVDVIGTAMGWGFTNDGLYLTSEVSPDLQSVTLESVPFEECRRANRYIKKWNICMTGAKKGTCTGDSGGPLVTKIDKLFYQIGLVSYGTDCNNTTPEIYVRVSAYYHWIASHVNLPHHLRGYN